MSAAPNKKPSVALGLILILLLLAAVVFGGMWVVQAAFTPRMSDARAAAEAASAPAQTPVQQTEPAVQEPEPQEQPAQQPAEQTAESRVTLMALGDDLIHNCVYWSAETPEGVKVMSINLLLPNETDPVIWRGPVIGGAVKQFWTDVCWGEVDYMFVDLPPGTGDVMLTVFQSLPIDGVVIVTSPQSLVSMIVSKAVNMARMMNVPVYGFVENYSYFQCPDCGKRVEIFGKSRLDELALQFSLPVLARLPINPDIASLFDEGKMAQADVSAVLPAAELMAKA